MKLSRKIDPIIEYNGYGYEFRNDFRVYLSAYSILKDKSLIEEMKIDTLFEIIFKENNEVGIIDKVKLITEFFKKFAEGSSSSKPVFDMEQDADYIYSGFLQAYRIDLHKAKLSIDEFMALLKGLPGSTKFAEVVKIRTMPVPKATQYNAEQRCAIMKAKQTVALKNEDDVCNSWKSFGNAIKSMAQEKK